MEDLIARWTPVKPGFLTPNVNSDGVPCIPRARAHTLPGHSVPAATTPSQHPTGHSAPHWPCLLERRPINQREEAATADPKLSGQAFLP